MSRSRKQRRASRTNGAHSNGPVSPEGKLRVTHNAFKHGLSAKSLLLTTEEKPEFDRMLQSFTETFQPANDPEWLTVEEMVTFTWKLRRIWCMQTANLEMQMEKDMPWIETHIRNCDETTRITIADDHLCSEKSTERLRRYENQIQQQYNRAYKRLRQMQQDRRNNSQHPATEPKIQNEPDKPIIQPDPPPEPPTQPIDPTPVTSQETKIQNEPDSPISEHETSRESEKVYVEMERQEFERWFPNSYVK